MVQPVNRLGELLEAERSRRDLTLTDFARDVLGLDHSQVSRYINGVQSPARRTVRKIAAALGVTVGEIDAMLAEADAARRGRHKPGLGPTGEDQGDVTHGPSAVLVVSAPAVGETRIDDPRLVGYFYGFLSKWARMTEEERESLLADEVDIPEPPAAGGERDVGGGRPGPGGAR